MSGHWHPVQDRFTAALKAGAPECVGTVSAAALGSYIAWEARNLGMSKWNMARMAGNIGFDMLLGAIPWIGAVPDFFFRSNTRNLRIIKRHLDKHHPLTKTLDIPPQSVP